MQWLPSYLSLRVGECGCQRARPGHVPRRARSGRSKLTNTVRSSSAGQPTHPPRGTGQMEPASSRGRYVWSSAPANPKVQAPVCDGDGIGCSTSRSLHKGASPHSCRSNGMDWHLTADTIPDALQEGHSGAPVLSSQVVSFVITCRHPGRSTDGTIAKRNADLPQSNDPPS